MRIRNGKTSSNHHPGAANTGRARTALAACALTGAAVITLAIIASACSGGGAQDAPSTPAGTPFVTPQATLPAVSPDTADKAGLLVYRDTVAKQVFALNLSTGERLPATGVNPIAAGNLDAFDCTRDGRLIAYSNSAADGRISVVSFAGEGAPGRAIEIPGLIQSMTWAPGGDRIAIGMSDQVGYFLAILDVASGQTTRLHLGQNQVAPTPSLNPLPFTPPPPGSGTPSSPRWSPEGQRLAVSIEYNGISDIFVVDVASANVTKVSTRPTAVTPDWSPDGRTIAFSGGDEQGSFPQLYLVEADGTNERKLTTSETQKTSPRWSLDGSLVSYAGLTILPAVSSRPALLHNQAVWVVSADGSNETPVTELALDAQPLAWCMRGAWLG